MNTSKDVLTKMRIQRKGKVHPAFVYLDGIDRPFLEAYNSLAVLNFAYGREAKGRAMPAKIKELIAIALLAAVRGDTTRDHIRKAISHGASRREIVEALEMSMHITGAPSLEFGLMQLMAVDEKP
ncbi:MAG: carboxymuconolactone decarboxylase family protein [Bryobacterales bacterium]|nr:carboxymuconolactone decarboxylase family protein [Bryobacterales bacterium]